MDIKYIVFFCLTSYYTPMVNSMTPQEIENLWNKIRRVGVDYIVYNDFYNYYGADTMDLAEVMTDYGSPEENDEGEQVTVMSYEQFVVAAAKGLIPKWSRRVMYAEFKHIMPAGEDRDFLTLDDLINYYVPRHMRTVIQLEKVMETYGVLQQMGDGEQQNASVVETAPLLEAASSVVEGTPLLEAAVVLEAAAIIEADAVVEAAPAPDPVHEDNLILPANNQYRLSFKNFRIAMCIGDLPKPSFENGYAR